MSRTRVLFLTGSLNLGGTERNILHLATALNPEKFKVEVWSDYEGEPLQHELRKRGVTCRSFKGKPSIGKSFLTRIICHNLPYQWRLFRALRKKRHAVIHAFGFPMIYYAALLGYAAGCKKIVFAVQDWDVWKRSFVYRTLDWLSSRVASKIIADGEGARQLAITKQGMDESRISTIYDGVNTTEITPSRSYADVRKELGLDAEKFTVGVIARLDIAKKGQDVFIESLASVIEKVPEAQFVIVGDGPDRAEIERLAAEMPAACRPVIAGFRTDLADITAALDVLVISSRWESVPKILLEAMWLKRTVIATRVGDIEEILDEQCGILVPSDDVKSMSDAIVAASDKALRERLGDAAKARIIERKLTLDASIILYENLYESFN